MKKQASSADRHQAVVKGQENLVGIKEFRIKRVLKQNEEGDYIVTESARSEMLYDSVETAEDAYKNIKDAQEEAEFDENGEDMEFNKDAGLHFGMSVKGCYVGSYDPLTNKYEIHNEQGSTHIDSKLLNIAAANTNVGICVKCGAIYTVPPADLGMGGISQTEPKYPTDFSKGGESQAHDLCPFCGKGVQPDVETPSTFTQDTYDTSHGHKLPGVDPEQNYSSLLQPGFNVSPLEHELQLGVNRELEHVADPSKAVEISLDHLAEDEDYYTKLNKVMPESGPEHKQPRILNIKEVKKEHSDNKDHNDSFEMDIDGIISHAAAEYSAIMKKAVAESDEASNYRVEDYINYLKKNDEEEELEPSNDTTLMLEKAMQAGQQHPDGANTINTDTGNGTGADAQPGSGQSNTQNKLRKDQQQSQEQPQPGSSNLQEKYKNMSNSEVFATVGQELGAAGKTVLNNIVHDTSASAQQIKQTIEDKLAERNDFIDDTAEALLKELLAMCHKDVDVKSVFTSAKDYVKQLFSNNKQAFRIYGISKTARLSIDTLRNKTIEFINQIAPGESLKAWRNDKIRTVNSLPMDQLILLAIGLAEANTHSFNKETGEFSKSYDNDDDDNLPYYNN